MAIKIPGFKFPGGAEANTQAPPQGVGNHTTLIMEGVRKLSGRTPSSLPLIGHLPVERQYVITVSSLAISLLLAASALIYNTTQVSNKTIYIGTSTEMQMLSQRLAKGAQQAVLGNAVAFRQLKESEEKFESALKKLTHGGDGLPASPADVQPVLSELNKQWQPSRKDIDLILAQEKKLTELNRSVAAINNNNFQLLELTEQVVALMTQSAAPLREVSIASQQVMLTQRMAKNANALLSSDIIDPEVVFLLGRDSETFRAILMGLLNGSEELRLSAVRDTDTRDKLAELQEVYKEFERDVATIRQNLQELVSSKQAGRSIFVGSDKILSGAQKLTKSYDTAGTLIAPALAGLFGLSALASLVMLGLANVNEAKRQGQQSDQENKRNQEAILRLLNEMGDLAEGDLTVHASVTEDITGAIADSVNYTIDELRSLVTGINKATEQVTQATQQAQQISNQLLDAAERQSHEIEETSASVLQMAQSINEVSASANESAKVAQQSLMAAEKGAVAVQNSIAGMNEIREQIQETSKRIKRLGESSQEIGEIVELISDITEQTNVLALNAAIQAASAGEAGRGFTVVAEEVQRLAERSAEATKQIGAIVKTIQTDTHDAVAAMETSTQGVVEGAKLSDAAGHSLNEIGQVSRSLAELIQSISSATQAQAEVAGKVAKNMQDIQSINLQTADGTKQTAVSIGQLSDLATELKGSVAGFKLS